MGVSYKRTLGIFVISPNISGKLSRLRQYERLNFSNKVNLSGGILLSMMQCSIFKNLSLSNNPSTTLGKLSRL
jgi:hypothetical protein